MTRLVGQENISWRRSNKVKTNVVLPEWLGPDTHMVRLQWRRRSIIHRKVYRYMEQQLKLRAELSRENHLFVTSLRLAWTDVRLFTSLRSFALWARMNLSCFGVRGLCFKRLTWLQNSRIKESFASCKACRRLRWGNFFNCWIVLANFVPDCVFFLRFTLVLFITCFVVRRFLERFATAVIVNLQILRFDFA